MRELSDFCKNLKKGFINRQINPNKPVGFWPEKDILNGKITDSFVIILRTRGCSWSHKSGCSMCGYFNDTMWGDDVTDENLKKQFEAAMDGYNNEKIVKIFNSGSFFDEREISIKLRYKILNKLFEKAEKISVESRPEYIMQTNLSDLMQIIVNGIFEVGVGLETSNDFIRKYSINKGFTFNDYIKSAKVLKNNNIKLKTYVLIKPPFVNEKQSINDAIETVKKIKDITDIISFNPVNIQRNTLVSFLWNRKYYRPPWLFSIVEILKESKKISRDILLKCDIVGGGNIRGAHNCRICDKEFLKSIKEFSLYQNLDVLENLDCECRDKWLDQIDIEEYGFGSLVNMFG
jgi:radical SAM enzyme (TIGR01210 family)